MEKSYKKVSKPGSVGSDMKSALKGDTQGGISIHYKGKPRNADPNYPSNPDNQIPVKEYTQKVMQEGREKNKK